MIFVLYLLELFTSLFSLTSINCSIVYAVRRIGVLTDDALGVSMFS